MNADMLCPWCKSPPCSDATGAICSTTTDWECGSSIGCAHQWQSSACKRIERLQAIIDRQHAALVVAGTECDGLGESDLHALACIAGTEDGRCEPSDDDYAEAYIRAVEAL